jgi:hypothetical protein
LNDIVESKTPDVCNTSTEVDDIILTNDKVQDDIAVVDIGKADIIVETDKMDECIIITEDDKDDTTKIPDITNIVDTVVDIATVKDGVQVQGAQCKPDVGKNANSSFDPLTFVFTLKDIPTWSSLGIKGRDSRCPYEVDASLNKKISVFACNPCQMIKTDVFAYVRCRHLTEKQRHTSTFFKGAGLRFLQEYEDMEIGELTDGKICITKAFNLEHVKYIYHAKGPEAPDSHFAYYEDAFENILDAAEEGHHKTLVIDIWKEDDEVKFDPREGEEMAKSMFGYIRDSLESYSQWKRIIVCPQTDELTKMYLKCIPFAFPTVDYEHDVQLSDKAWTKVIDKLW